MSATGSDVEPAPADPVCGVPILPHLSLNEAQPTTIVLLHGLLSSPDEFRHVIPHLSGYHLLVPHLPDHASTRNFTPFTLPHAGTLVTELIRTHAHNAIAHIVGVSAGGYVALSVAQEHPDVVLSIFASGVAGLTGRTWLAAIAPYVLLSVTWLQYIAPQLVFDYVQRSYGLQIPSGLRETMWTNARLHMMSTIYSSIAGDSVGHSTLTTRTLVLAGTKGDDVAATRTLGKGLVKGNRASKAAMIEGAVHAWDLQLPQLFASGVEAWVERKGLPTQFQLLDG